jgi:hypothetical protein
VFSKSTLTNVDVVKCGGDGYASACSTIVVDGDVEGLSTLNLSSVKGTLLMWNLLPTSVAHTK